MERSRQDTLRSLEVEGGKTQELLREVTKFDEDRLIILAEYVQAGEFSCTQLGVRDCAAYRAREMCS